MIEKFGNVKDYRWLKRYLKFIEIFKKDGVCENTHKHHIFPVANYPEYKSFDENSWNEAILTYRAHLIAHYMLAKALGGNMWFAYNNMNAHNKRLNSILYESAIIEFKKAVSLNRQGFISAIDLTTNKTLVVTKKEFDDNDNLVGITKGLFSGDKNVSHRQEVKEKISEKMKDRIHCIDKTTGKRKFIKREEFSEEKYEIVKITCNSGFVIVKSKDGPKRISIDEYNKGGYEHINKGCKRSKEFCENLSKRTKGVKKKNTKKYFKTKKLISDDGVEYTFLGYKLLQEFCYERNLSLTILCKNKNKVVTELTTAKNKKYIETSKNTLGWKLITI